jgi:hypothetical protein
LKTRAVEAWLDMRHAMARGTYRKVREPLFEVAAHQLVEKVRIFGI